MKKTATQPKTMNEAQVLDLLKKVLPKATHDPKLAGQIYDAIEREFKRKASEEAFAKFCAKAELPDLEHKSLVELERQLADAFGQGADVTLKPNKREEAVAVEVGLPDGSQFAGRIEVRETEEAAEEGDPEVTVKFAPCPVSLPGDTELVWMLAKRETMTPEEAGIALTKLEDDFWASKTGQKLIRDRVERSFPEFISRVPAGMLSEVGLKRHYKIPEPVKVLAGPPPKPRKGPPANKE
jgi:hypothetical protein